MKKEPRKINPEDKPAGYKAGFEKNPANLDNDLIAGHTSEWLDGWIEGTFERIHPKQKARRR